MRRQDQQLIAQVLHPDSVWSAAEEYGEGDPVLGAPQAYKEARTMVRDVVYAARKREKLGKDLGLALMMRNLGLAAPNERVQVKIMPDHNNWRKTACKFWPGGGPMMGGLTVETNLSFEKFYRKVIKITSQMLVEEPETNRAVLDNRIWQRLDGNVMIHFEIDGEIRSMVFNPGYKLNPWIDMKIRRGMKAALKIGKTQLVPLMNYLMQEWAERGFLISTAGAMVSGAPYIPMGWAPLVACNGIPLTICVNRIQDNKCFIGITPDHRAFDGAACNKIYWYLEKNLDE